MFMMYNNIDSDTYFNQIMLMVGNVKWNPSADRYNVHNFKLVDTFSSGAANC